MVDGSTPVVARYHWLPEGNARRCSALNGHQAALVVLDLANDDRRIAPPDGGNRRKEWRPVDKLEGNEGQDWRETKVKAGGKRRSRLER